MALPLIPPEAYASISPLQGFDQPALLANELQDALESVKEKRSPDYFQNIQKEFLTHAFMLLMDHEKQADLADIHAFASSNDVRKAILGGCSSQESKRAVLYFEQEFGCLSSQDQADLLRGLASQLALLSDTAVRRAFCPTRPGAHRPLESWLECLAEKPGIVVFSCPPALYTQGLSRILALLTLRSFQQAMTRRSDASFTGNRRRLVTLFADEAHAVFNKSLASFLAVSRQAKVMSVLGTQNITQVPADYRDELTSGCRTRVILGKQRTKRRGRFQNSLGAVVNAVEAVSFSQGHRGGTSGASRPVTTRSHSYSLRERPRFNTTTLGQIPLGQGIAHVFDGERLLPSCRVETDGILPPAILPFGSGHASHCCVQKWRLPHLQTKVAHRKTQMPDMQEDADDPRGGRLFGRKTGPGPDENERLQGRWWRLITEYLILRAEGGTATQGEFAQTHDVNLRTFQAHLRQSGPSAAAQLGLDVSRVVHPKKSRRVQLTERDLAMLSRLGHDRVHDLPFVASLHFQTAQHPTRSAMARLRELEEAGYVQITGFRIPLISLSKKGARAVGAKVKPVHPRHLRHHLATLRAIEAFRKELATAGGTFADRETPSGQRSGYLLEFHVQAEDRRGGARTTSGVRYDASPDAVVFAKIPGDQPGNFHVQRVAIEYFTRAYSDAQIRTKATFMQTFDAVYQVADTKSTATRVAFLTKSPCAVQRRMF